jgi:chemotaxis family two-component system sensor kinase Cph1
MIGSYVTLIERRYADLVDEEGKEFFEYATRGVKQMKQLLDDLLKYMVVETNDYELEDVPLDEVLSSVQANLLTRVKETNANIQIDELPIVHGNRSLLILLFQNLISNALKFRSDNKPELKITVSRQGKQYLFAITDNGIGISKQYQDRIFSIFYRVYGKHQYEGTGIGLSICQKIVGLHGGKIWVESEEGKGSTFYFTLGDMVDAIIQPSTAALHA